MNMDAMKLLVEVPQLQAMHDYDYWSEYEKLTADQKARVHYSDPLITLGEMVWLAQDQELLNYEWPYWRRWLKERYKNSSEFRFTVDAVEDEI